MNSWLLGIDGPLELHTGRVDFAPRIPEVEIGLGVVHALSIGNIDAGDGRVGNKPFRDQHFLAHDHSEPGNRCESGERVAGIIFVFVDGACQKAIPDRQPS